MSTGVVTKTTCCIACAQHSVSICRCCPPWVWLGRSPVALWATLTLTQGARALSFMPACSVFYLFCKSCTYAHFMGIPVALYYSDFRRYERRGSWKPKMLWVCYFLRPNIQSVFTKKSSIVVHIQSKWKSNKNGMSPLCRWGYIGAVLSHSTLRSRLKSSPDSSPLFWLTYYRTSQLFESPS